MVVSAALSLMLTLGAELVPPDGCSVIAAWPDGSAVAACADAETWFVYEPDLTRDGLWSLTRSEPPGLAPLGGTEPRTGHGSPRDMIPDGPRSPMNGGLRNAIAQEARNGASTRSYSRTGRMVRLRYAVAYDLGADTISPGELNRIVERGAPIMTTLSRRALVVSSAAGAALAHLAPRHQVLAQSSTPTASSPPPAQEAGAPPATWRTWILTTPDELRPVAPAAPAQTEIDELLQFQAERNDETIALIRQWNSRPAVLPWTEVAIAAGFEFMTSPLRQNRLNGMLQTAMYDAVIAAYDAQEVYTGPHPAELDSQITPLEGIVADRPSFPSAEAAVAGAAAAVLTALLPDAAPGRFTDLAKEAAVSRLHAGVNVRSDIDAGLALGKAIGERAVALGADDAPGSDWDGSGRLTGPGYWEPTPPGFVESPAEPLLSTWHRWVLESPDQFRPAPPPAYDSPAWRSQLAAVQEAVARRTFAQATQATYWQESAAPALWDGFASDLITRYQLDLPHAARVLALTGVAMADAAVACWDAKYTYWVARPITADPELDVLFPTPAHPSFPSAHASFSNAAAIVLVHLFPHDALDLLALGAEAAASRGWAGIHFPIDNDAGLLLGRNVGYLVTNVARSDGAE